MRPITLAVIDAINTRSMQFKAICEEWMAIQAGYYTPAETTALINALLAQGYAEKKEETKMNPVTDLKDIPYHARQAIIFCNVKISGEATGYEILDDGKVQIRYRLWNGDVVQVVAEKNETCHVPMGAKLDRYEIVKIKKVVDMQHKIN